MISGALVGAARISRCCATICRRNCSWSSSLANEQLNSWIRVTKRSAKSFRTLTERQVSWLSLYCSRLSIYLSTYLLIYLSIYTARQSTHPPKAPTTHPHIYIRLHFLSPSPHPSPSPYRLDQRPTYTLDFVRNKFNRTEVMVAQFDRHGQWSMSMVNP